MGCNFVGLANFRLVKLHLIGWDGDSTNPGIPHHFTTLFFFLFLLFVPKMRGKKNLCRHSGRVHLPPPIHQTFETSAFVICSFVPRLYDYHPESIPSPYNHSNIDSEEVLYYVDGDFMSRNNIERGQITLHPAGLVHGPHPGAYERSIGKKETQELAVMVDTFKPLKLTKQALELPILASLITSNYGKRNRKRRLRTGENTCRSSRLLAITRH